MKTQKRRRTRLGGKTDESKEDDLPWAAPLTYDPTFLPTSLYKNSLSRTLIHSLSNFAQPRSLEPYHHANMGNDGLFKFNPCLSSTRMDEPPNSSGYLSASISSPVRRFENLAASREASNSCPTIAIPQQGTSFVDKTELSSPNGGTPRRPIGVFWDIENCNVPRGRSALVAVQRIRERFFGGHQEAEFVCVCDIRKEAPSIIQELNDAQISVVHVAGNSKNAADDKLRQAMRRFADISCSNPIHSSWTHPSTIVLISGDINFATDLSDLRYRKRLYVILLHNKQTPDALLLCAHEQYEFHSVLADLPFRPGYKDFSESFNQTIPLKGGLMQVDCLITNLPMCNNSKTQNFVRNRLRKLSENCGGKIKWNHGKWAVIRFPNYEAALRATKRMNGEDVLGFKIQVTFNVQMDFSAPNFSQPSVVPEDDNCTGKLGKPQQGFSAWKPTWKPPQGASSDALAQPSRLGPGVVEGSKYENPRPHSITAQSNSSTPNDTSRDGSPGLVVPSNPPALVQHAHMSNLAPYQQASPQGAANFVASPPFTFLQGVYPNLEFGNMRQECQTPPSQLMPASEPSGAVDPRFYSKAVHSGCNSTAIPFTATNQHNCNVRFETGFDKLGSPINNAILVTQPTMTPLSGTMYVNGQGTIETTPGTSRFGNLKTNSKYRYTDQSQGDSFDLFVSNIDASIGDWKTIRGALTSAFNEHVNVRGVWVSVANDGSASATVKLMSKEEAHYAVAQLHRRKIGCKRIFISFDQGQNVDQDTLRKEVASLLQDVPNYTLPLFKFREMFEKRYNRSVSSYDLYRLKDVVAISENSNGNGGRNVTLTPDWQQKKSEGKGLDLYCKLHPSKLQGKTDKSRTGWAEKEAEVMFPNVIIEFKVFGSKIHSLLQSHDGGLPLVSLLDCYESEFEALERAGEGRGVPLEHLITCVQGVEIIYGENGMKRVQWNENVDGFRHCMVGQALQPQMSQFGRELIDLLKTFPKCSLPFAKLIPCYHAHFGRQCRVADYGHFSLSALLQTLPHIVQIMGAAHNRVLTLSHRAQMKRFATDMLRVLKSQGGPKKQLRMEEFPAAFGIVFPHREFLPEDYGLCYFTDLVTELVEHSTLVALIKDEDGNNVLAVPKREQTPQEIHKTRIFATEVVELLRHSTHCELEFAKFVPYYHHHFQKQCRVSDYGFGKLAELFEAVSDTVSLIHQSTPGALDNKIIRLTPKEQIKVVGEQICNIVQSRRRKNMMTRLSQLEECFSEENGFYLRPELCGVETLADLVYMKLDNFIKVIKGELIPVDRVQIEDLANKAEIILQKELNYQMGMAKFLAELNDKSEKIVVKEVHVEKDLSHVVLITDGEKESRNVCLAPLRAFAYELTLLLESYGGTIPLSGLENAYFEKFGRPIRPAQLGYPTVIPMLQAVSDTVTLRGKLRTKRIVVLNSMQPQQDSSGSDENSFGSGKGTPRSGSGDYWRTRESRPRNIGLGSKYGRQTDWVHSPTFAPAPPPPLYSPLSSPVVPPRGPDGNIFSFDRPMPLTPSVYDVWMQNTGSPPMSPPVVWTMHPVYYPSSPPTGGPGNIQIVTSPYLGPAQWSPQAIPTTVAALSPTAAAPPTMLGTEFLFGQNRLAASFEKLTLDPTGNEP